LVSVDTDSNLNLSASCCSPTLEGICTSACGSNDDCDTLHHKSRHRLLFTSTHSTYYTLRLVRYGLCGINNGCHGGGTIGYGDVRGKNSLVTSLCSPELHKTIQHELTHNLASSHDECNLDSGNCILKGDDYFDKWCDTCSTKIRELYE